jgi:hypothetical protein
MSDLETLRRALQAPPVAELARPRIGEVMSRGRRLRRRRRALAAGGFACLAAVLAAAGIGASQLGRPAAPVQQPPLTAVPPPHRPAGAYGAAIDTGIRKNARELVFFAVRIRNKHLPGDTFGLMGAYQDRAGHLSGKVETNETSGSDVTAGFHAIEAPINGIPEFGYYAGPAAKITGTVGGRTIRAATARWSVNKKIVIFWFSPRDNPGAVDVTNLAAFTAHGKKLPPGHSGVGHG